MPQPAEHRGAGRPIIGITCYEATASWGDWHTVAAVLPVSYVRSIERAGAIALLIPPQLLSAVETQQVVGRLDGLVLAGGNDVAPSQYGEEAHAATVCHGDTRDSLELATLHAATESGLPTLGICRGLQVLNVARGGTLVQHLPDLLGHDGHSPTPGGFGEHDVHIAEGSRLSDLLPWRCGSVPTHHHQAIADLGRGLVASARADDGVIEAVEDPGLPFVIAVQWHPEAGDEPELFEALVEAARGHLLVGKE
ncbi:MAG: gamma-glutamyl-gamma-aminobutyrate hydrolase family protein [Acidimicrobiales bacterium]